MYYGNNTVFRSVVQIGKITGLGNWVSNAPPLFGCSSSVDQLMRLELEQLYLIMILFYAIALQWRHNERDGVSNHQPRHCLLNRLFRRRSKRTSTLRVTGLCVGNSPMTGEFHAQMASYAEMFRFDDVIMPNLLYQHNPLIELNFPLCNIDSGIISIGVK